MSAVNAGQDQALAFLVDYGGELKLLDMARLSTCQAAASHGAVDVLLACAREAADRRSRLDDLIKRHDEAGFSALLASVADVSERDKVTLSVDVSRSGTAAMLALLLRRGASPDGQGPYAIYDPVAMKPLPGPVAYSGSLRGEAQAWAQASGYTERTTSGGYPLTLAVKRSDAEMVLLLADAGAENLEGAAVSVGGMDRGERFSMMLPDQVEDTETYPNGPDAAAMRVLGVLVVAIARTEGPQSLEAIFREATAQGWNDVLLLVLANGFRASEARGPDFIWESWAGLNGACKPSTGEVLVHAGLHADYPLVPARNGWRPEKIVAASCRDPASASVLIRAGLAHIDEIDDDGQTVLDTALQYRHPQMADAIRKLGGETAEQVDRPAYERRKARLRRENDSDLTAGALF